MKPTPIGYQIGSSFEEIGTFAELLRVLRDGREDNESGNVREVYSRYQIRVEAHRPPPGWRECVQFALALASNSRRLSLTLEAYPARLIVALAEALSHNVNLQALSLLHMDAEALQAVGQALRENTTITCLKLEADELDDGVGLAVAASLRQNSSLHSLSLGGDLVGDETGTALARVLMLNVPLKSLTLRGVHFNDATGVALAVALRHKTKIHALTLEGCGIGDATLSAFADTLRQNTTLQSLTLRGRGYFSDQAWTQVADSLSQNSALRSLTIVTSYSGKLAGPALAFALRSNTSLQFLQLRDLRIGDTMIAEVEDALQRNQLLPSQWSALAAVARPDGVGTNVRSLVSSTMTESRFQRVVFNFFLPSRALDGGAAKALAV
eukprot:TRINITY_DN54588_c0_g1_i1.p1 TRINITY_DN54588_c0_g1~~TRINITY_DN54588_c0_g1_i1.p1  ORF type:complete len:382 (+),score=49.06 TRINITY_DN54588_c0_g1_i1:74-1219(+)